jgi:hypothetical protein
MENGGKELFKVDFIDEGVIQWPDYKELNITERVESGVPSAGYICSYMILLNNTDINSTIQYEEEMENFRDLVEYCKSVSLNVKLINKFE